MQTQTVRRESMVILVLSMAAMAMTGVEPEPASLAIAPDERPGPIDPGGSLDDEAIGLTIDWAQSVAEDAPLFDRDDIAESLREAPCSRIVE